MSKQIVASVNISREQITFYSKLEFYNHEKINDDVVVDVVVVVVVVG